MVWPVSGALEALPVGLIQLMWTPTEHETLNQVTPMPTDEYLAVFSSLSNHRDCCREPRRTMPDNALLASCGSSL